MPIELQGEGHYALTDVKDIKVTEEFLGLGQEITKCQTREFRADCVSRRYQEQVLASCHCAPLYIRSHFPQQVLFNKTDVIEQQCCSNNYLIKSDKEKMKTTFPSYQ